MIIDTVSLAPTRPTLPAFMVDSTLTAADLGRLHFAESSAADEREKESFVAKSRKRRRMLDNEIDQLRARADALQAQIFHRPAVTVADAMAMAVTGYSVADVAPDDGWPNVVAGFSLLREASNRLQFEMMQSWTAWAGQEDNRKQDWPFMRAAFARVALALDGRDGVTLAEFCYASDLALLRGSLH